MQRQKCFLKSLPATLQHIKATKLALSNCSSINLYCEDESRFGLMSIQRRALTSKGVKPIVPYQHRFANFYLFGAYSPIDGTHCTLELPACNHICFQCFLDYFSKQQPEEFKILVLDNGALHKAKELKVPANIALLFIPPYSPELNPAEKIGRYLKDHLANEIFHNLDKLSDKLTTLIKEFDPPLIKSLTHNQLYNLNFMHTFDV